MRTRLNKVQSAQYLGISRRALYDWLEAAGLTTQETFTKGELDDLAARHGRTPDTPELRALRTELEALRQDVANLRAMVEAIQQRFVETSPSSLDGSPDQ